MITTSLPSGFATSQGVLADPVQRPVHQHEDVDGLMLEVVRVKTRQHALRLADDGKPLNEGMPRSAVRWSYACS